MAYQYRFSFLARLIQAEPEVKENYSAVKNHLFSYKKVTAGTAWGHETFRCGRRSCARIKVLGKTLYLYLALDPAPLAGTKYYVKDLSGKAGRDGLATMFRIRSKRGVKYAKELIDEMMRVLGVPQGEVQNIDYQLPYQTTEELLALPDPLVKLRKDAEDGQKEDEA